MRIRTIKTTNTVQYAIIKDVNKNKVNREKYKNTKNK